MAHAASKPVRAPRKNKGRPVGVTYTARHRERAQALASTRPDLLDMRFNLRSLDAALQREGFPPASDLSLKKWLKETQGDAAPLAVMLQDIGKHVAERVTSSSEADRLAETSRVLCRNVERMSEHLLSRLEGVTIASAEDLDLYTSALARQAEMAMMTARAAQALREPSLVAPVAGSKPPIDRAAEEQPASPFSGLQHSNFAEV